MIFADIIPGVSDITAKVLLMTGIAACAATLGFSIWAYLQAKNAADQALDDGGEMPVFDGEANMYFDEDGNWRDLKDQARWQHEFGDEDE